MIIGIDGNEANVTQRVGISEYSFHILRGLHERTKKERQTSEVKFKIYLKEQPRNDLPQNDIGWENVVFGPQKLWTQAALPIRLYLEREKLEVFFSPSHYAPRFIPSRIQSIISIMDLSYIHFPELFTKKDLYQLTSWTKYSADKAKKIITISESSKKDIVAEYGFSPEKVVVSYPGYDADNYNLPSQNSKLSNEIRDMYGVQKDYIFFVGTIQPRKNIIRLIEAFENIKHTKTESKALQLVLAGKRGWLCEEIIRKIEQSACRDDIIHIDFVPDKTLSELYKHAKCFVLPSLYEGFGIPVIEAMACGCPVVASNVSSLPEIVNDAGTLVDPTDTESLASAILEATYNESRRATLIKKGLKNIERFSMDTFIETIWHVIQVVASHGN